MKVIDWIKSLTIEDAKYAFIRFRKTFVYVALILGLRHVLSTVQNSDDPMKALGDIELWKDGWDVVVDAVLVGLIWGADKISRSGRHH